MRTASLIALVILFPALAHATVNITEIMYDLSGTDTGREWVEITNTGNSAVDVSGYKFFEANVNHSLTLVAGTGTLAAGSSAIIADDATKFKIDWPSYSGILFDSSFSLSNTGESLALKDDALTVLDSASYDPSLGATGDGNTLQWNGSAFAPAAPTLGTYSESGDTGGGDTATTTPASSGSSGGTYTPPPSSIVVKISGARKAFMEVPMTLSARATNKSGVVDSGAQIVWSFGDGSSATGIEVTKTYHYAGTYVVTVIANNGVAKAREEMVISVTPALVHIVSASSEGIMITNDSDERLDLSQWRLSSTMGSFHIPEGTTILSEASVLFPYAITNLPIAFDATLSYPNGVVAARFAPTIVAPQPSVELASSNQVQTVEQIISLQTPVESYENKAVIAPTATSDTGVAVGAELTAPTAPPTLASAVTAPEAPKTPSGGFFHSVWTLGLLGVMALAAGAFILL